MLAKVLAQLKLKKTDISQDLYVEKVLPNAKTNSVMVIPKYRKNETDQYGGVYLELDAFVVIANNITGKILHKYHETNAWTSDAIAILGIIIDTGIYTLNSETRAFGIRVSYANGSQPNPYRRTDLSLFIRKDKSLKKVLKEYPMATSGGEWDTKCAGEFEETNAVIDIDGTKTNGLNNLIFKETIVTTKRVAKDDDCIEKKTTKYRSIKLKYNGVEYK
ncbi:hypothetical protein EZ449_03475 [Pedobacter frigidisoli]|uniref:Uncharacterized protein n=1 Tax=Pedobacter frigidisoli TaxID=2530455 RepID=A0A4R0P5Q1_9SPHI|nr:hypothetical protein EZ449_03475 [Pedobacter frigidisoli]